MKQHRHPHISGSLWGRGISCFLSLFLALTVLMPLPAQAYSATTVQMMLYVNQHEVFINGEEHRLDVPAQVVNGRMYVPLKFLGDAMGFTVQWDHETRTIQVETEKASVLISQEQGRVWTNGLPDDLDNVGMIVDGRLLVQIAWFSDLTTAVTAYNGQLNRVEVTYVRQPRANENRPVAKFALGKSSYGIGEKIDYIDLSYHPDAEGLRSVQWTGRQEAFFEPGEYAVTLKVSDRHGIESFPFTKTIHITDEVYFNELDYQIYHKPVEQFIRADRDVINNRFNHHLTTLPRNTSLDTSRKLLVSNSPETFSNYGVLYRDTVDGKARLYATHINGMEQNARFMIIATNKTNQPVTVRTTNKGEVAPSAYANLIGHVATMDYLVREPMEETLQLPAGQSRVFVTMADFLPTQGINAFYDVETDGAVDFHFMVTEPNSGTVNPLYYPKLAYDGHVRGTFSVSDVTWSVDGSTITRPSRLTIGDDNTDPFVTGYDPMRGYVVTNRGNYGVIYDIQIRNPQKMAVLLLARGGPFSGPFKINEKFVKAPVSGVITAFDGVQVLARTSGNEDMLKIEFSPPSGSAFPVDLIFYPLEDR